MAAVTEGGRGVAREAGIGKRRGVRSRLSYTCARARKCVWLLWRGRGGAVAGACWCAVLLLLVCAGGVDRGAAGAVWPGVCQSVGESCRCCSVDVAGI